MVTSWVADEFQTVIKLVPTYLCLKRFCRTAVSQSEKSIHTDHGISNVNDLKYFKVKRLKSKSSHESLVLKPESSYKSLMILSSQVQSHQIYDSGQV